MRSPRIKAALRRAWGRLVLWMIQPALEESGRAAVELSSDGQTYQAGIGVTTDGRIYRAGIGLASLQASRERGSV